MCSMLDIHAAWSATLCCGPSGSRRNRLVTSDVGGSNPSGTNASEATAGVYRDTEATHTHHLVHQVALSESDRSSWRCLDQARRNGSSTPPEVVSQSVLVRETSLQETSSMDRISLARTSRATSTKQEPPPSSSSPPARWPHGHTSGGWSGVGLSWLSIRIVVAAGQDFWLVAVSDRDRRFWRRDRPRRSRGQDPLAGQSLKRSGSARSRSRRPAGADGQGLPRTHAPWRPSPGLPRRALPVKRAVRNCPSPRRRRAYSK